MRSSKPAEATPLPTADLIALAAGPALPPALRDQVIATFEENPGAVAELRAAADAVPAEIVADPFVSALRRLCRPTDRLSAGHRQALAGVGQRPCSFAALVLEEARTFGWRNLKAAPLMSLSRWLDAWQGRHKSLESAEIATRALNYQLFLAMVVGLVCEEDDSYKSLIADLTKASSKPGRCDKEREDRGEDEMDTVIETEGILGFALVLATAGAEEAAKALLEPAAAKSQQGEPLAWFELTRAWIFGFIAEDIGRAEHHIALAIAALDDDSDPWLELLLRLLAARTIVDLCEERIPAMGPRIRTLRKGFEKGKIKKDSPLRVDPLRATFEAYWHDLEADRQNLKPALDHLMAGETLFREFATPEMKIQYLSMRSKLLLVPDLVQAQHDLIDAIVAARSLPGYRRLESMMLDSAFINTRLAEYALGLEEYPGVALRYRELVEPHLLKAWAEMASKHKAKAKAGKKGNKPAKGRKP